MDHPMGKCDHVEDNARHNDLPWDCGYVPPEPHHATEQ
jgi:hypothetical protein